MLTLYFLLQESVNFLTAAKIMLNYMNTKVIVCKLETHSYEEQELRTRKLSETKSGLLSNSPTLSFKLPGLSTWPLVFILFFFKVNFTSDVVLELTTLRIKGSMLCWLSQSGVPDLLFLKTIFFALFSCQLASFEFPLWNPV